MTRRRTGALRTLTVTTFAISLAWVACPAPATPDDQTTEITRLKAEIERINPAATWP